MYQKKLCRPCCDWMETRQDDVCEGTGWRTDYRDIFIVDLALAFLPPYFTESPIIRTITIRLATATTTQFRFIKSIKMHNPGAKQ